MSVAIWFIHFQLENLLFCLYKKIRSEPYLFSTPLKWWMTFNVASCMELYLLSPACIIMRAPCMYMPVKAESWCKVDCRVKSWTRAREMLSWDLEGSFGIELEMTRWTWWLTLLNISNHPWILVCCYFSFCSVFMK